MSVEPQTNTVADVRTWSEHYRALPWERPGFEWSDAEKLRGGVLSAFLLESGVPVLLAALARKDAALRAARCSLRDCACPINQPLGCRPCAVARQINAALNKEA